VCGRRVARRSGVDDGDAASGATEDERGVQAGSSASDDRDVMCFFLHVVQRPSPRTGHQGLLPFLGTAASVES
jgi:hypothetical protein